MEPKHSRSYHVIAIGYTQYVLSRYVSEYSLLTNFLPLVPVYSTSWSDCTSTTNTIKADSPVISSIVTTKKTLPLDSGGSY